MTQWYYADHNHQQQGPVAAGELARLYHEGQVDDATLVWREGLPEWQPLAGFTGELGLDVVAPPTPPAPAPAAAAAPAPATEPPPSTPAQEPALQLEPMAAGTTETRPTDAPVAETWIVPEPARPYTPYNAPASSGHEAAAPSFQGGIVLAGFWKRVAAYLVDSLIVGVVGGMIGFVLGLFALPLAMAGDESGAGAVLVQLAIQLVSMAITAAYYAGFHASRGGATPGKMLIGIKVVRTDGSRISVLRGVGRYFGALLSGLVLCIGYLMAAFTGRKQALHDMLCDTLVVDKWAFTEHPEWQRRELGTATIVVLVLGGLMMVVGLLMVVAVIGALASFAG